jgi:hypothetical protein
MSADDGDDDEDHEGERREELQASAPVASSAARTMQVAPMTAAAGRIHEALAAAMGAVNPATVWKRMTSVRSDALAHLWSDAAVASAAVIANHNGGTAVRMARTAPLPNGDGDGHQP